MNQPVQPKPVEETYERLNHTETAPKMPIRSTNPFQEDVQHPPTPVRTMQSTSQGYSATSDESYWENTDEYYGKSFFHHCFSHDDSITIDQNYQPGPPPAYYPEEYHDHRPSSIRKGVSVRISFSHINT